MADIANIRRRRLERLVINPVPVAAAEAKAAEDAPSKKSSKGKSGGMTAQATQDSSIPSEFECILCLRCVSSRHCGTGRGWARFVRSLEKGLPPSAIFWSCNSQDIINYLLAARMLEGWGVVPLFDAPTSLWGQSRKHALRIQRHGEFMRLQQIAGCLLPRRLSYR